MKKITLLIADDHTLLRESWAHVLNSNEQFLVVAQAATGEEAIQLACELRPEIVLMDINLPGISGIDATAQIRKFAPGTRIIGVTLHSQPAYMQKMIKQGASGYITKNSGRDEMFKAILEVHAGKRYICEEVKSILSSRMLQGEETAKGINSLSQREIDIVKQIVKGHSSKEIGELLFISSKTVEVHRYNILRKLELKNAASLVNYINQHAVEFD